jgi:class 3 adenylate cyclase
MTGKDAVPPCVLVIDDEPKNAKLLADLLAHRGYRTEQAHDGLEGLRMARTLRPDLILLDVLMPGLDGFEVCRRLKNDEATQATPVVLVTLLDAKEDRVKGLEAGADDFLTKPPMQAELFARVRSLLRVKAYYDEVARQRSELALWSATLERRVAEKTDEVTRLAELKRFFSPRLAAKLLGDGREALMQSHRKEITVLFADLRDFTPFAESQDADAVMSLVREFHAAMGELIFRFDGTLERFTGDGMMVFFNDPDPLPDHSLRAVQLGLAMCQAVDDLLPAWRARGGPTGVSVGVSRGVATLGAIGFPARLDYAAIGTVTNLAARLCEKAHAGEVVVSDDVWRQIERRGLAAREDELSLKGFVHPVRCHRLQAT